MEERTLEGHHGRQVTIDVCTACQSFWFDSHESVHLAPGATLALFRLIGSQSDRRSLTHADVAHCPR